LYAPKDIPVALTVHVQMHNADAGGANASRSNMSR